MSADESALLALDVTLLTVKAQRLLLEARDLRERAEAHRDTVRAQRAAEAHA